MSQFLLDTVPGLCYSLKRDPVAKATRKSSPGDPLNSPNKYEFPREQNGAYLDFSMSQCQIMN